MINAPHYDFDDYEDRKKLEFNRPEKCKKNGNKPKVRSLKVLQKMEAVKAKVVEVDIPPFVRKDGIPMSIQDLMVKAKKYEERIKSMPIEPFLGHGTLHRTAMESSESDKIVKDQSVLASDSLGISVNEFDGTLAEIQSSHAEFLASILKGIVLNENGKTMGKAKARTMLVDALKTNQLSSLKMAESHVFCCVIKRDEVVSCSDPKHVGARCFKVVRNGGKDPRHHFLMAPVHEMPLEHFDNVAQCLVPVGRWFVCPFLLKAAAMLLDPSAWDFDDGTCSGSPVAVVLASAADVAADDCVADFLDGVGSDSFGRFSELRKFRAAMSAKAVPLRLDAQEKAIARSLLESHYVSFEDAEAVEEHLTGGRADGVLVCAGRSWRVQGRLVAPAVPQNLSKKWPSIVARLKGAWKKYLGPLPSAGPEVRLCAAAGSVIARVDGLGSESAGALAFAIKNDSEVERTFVAGLWSALSGGKEGRSERGPASMVEVTRTSDSPGLRWLTIPTEPYRDTLCISAFQAVDEGNKKHLSSVAASVHQAVCTFLRYRHPSAAAAPAVQLWYVDGRHHMNLVSVLAGDHSGRERSNGNDDEYDRIRARNFRSACERCPELAKVIRFENCRKIMGDTVVLANDTHGAKTRFLFLCSDAAAFASAVPVARVAFRRLGIRTAGHVDAVVVSGLDGKCVCNIVRGIF